MAPLEEVAHLADVLIELNVKLDHRILPIRQILELEAGSVIKMSRSAGENIDILAGGTLIGFGEIVIIEDTVGVRITDFNEED
ncbi:MAG TPA: FliM/FliN family flagellar motor switch protein [Bryobacteraceae bacterium]|nr:FliM/FliN family flagellar motor switch protein [Bryobacteraceae bacterium]